MALTLINASVSTLSVPVGNDLLVTRSGEVLTPGAGITLSGGDGTILGLVMATSFVIGPTAPPPASQRLTIGADGILMGVSGSVSALVPNATVVDNAGWITATDASAIQLGFGNAGVSILNSGRITARDAAIFMSDTPGATVRNTGLIDGGSFGISVEIGALDLLNGAGGTVSGGQVGVLLATGGNDVVNNGLIAGLTGLQVSTGVNRIENGGSIQGTANGILVEATAGATVIANAGQVSGGVILQGNGHSLVSSGTIANTGTGRAAVSVGGNTTTVVNGGTLQATDLAVSLADTSVLVVVRNTGTVLGGVDLGAGSNASANFATLGNTLANIGSITGANTAVLAGVAARVSNDGAIAGRIGIHSEGGGAQILNAGEISGRLYGVQLAPGTDTLINSGTISGSTAVFVGGTSTFLLRNTGTIAGTESAITATGSSAGTTISNDGDVAGGLFLGAASVSNAGTILGGVSFLGAGQLLNTGTIQPSGGVAVNGSLLADEVVNAGIMTNGVFLNGGNDLYDGTLGRVLRGRVDGETGNDTLIGGAGREELAGGVGNDSLEGGGGNDLLTGGIGLDTLEGGEGNDVLRPGASADEIDGGSGRDRLDYLGSTAVNVDLETGVAFGGDATGDIFMSIEDVGGTLFNDTLTGDDGANALFGNSGNDSLVGGAGNDVLVGDAGNDTLIGGLGVDIMRGGPNADVFRFAAAAATGAPGVLRDRILDFSKAELDRIDVSFIDANGTTPGMPDFTFIGAAAAFTGVGQLRSQVIGGDTLVFGNTDAGLITAEFSIRLTGVVALTAADFIL